MKQLDMAKDAVAHAINLGWVYGRQEQYYKTLKLYEEILPLARQTNDSTRIAFVLNNYMSANFSAGDYAEAARLGFRRNGYQRGSKRFS